MSVNRKDAYVTAYRGFTSNGAAGDPIWLKSLRERGIGQFAELDFPTTRQEDWRFTSVKSVIEADFELASGGTTDASTVAEFGYGTDPGARIVTVNGSTAMDQTLESRVPKGVVICSLQQAIREHADILQEHLGRYVNGSANAFAALNTAFASQGVFVYVPANTTVDTLIELLYLMQPAATPIVAHPRSLIVVESGAKVRIVETYASAVDDCYLTNAVTEAVVGDGASVDLYRVQRESPNAFHLATTYSTQGRDSRYSIHTIPLGSRLSRHDIRMVMNGEGGHGTLNGLYVLRGEQHVDHNTVIEHAKPHCESHEYFNGILDDAARAVFNGRIIVRPGAQKTDSKQTNNNLLLSKEARADSQPQLEIYADDVRCTHGATLGPLDANALFYLQSRGIEAGEARRMLTMGFGMEVLTGIELPNVRERLESLVQARLGAALGASV
jgi:Fe-S cluster assembly protein SufD